MLAVVDIVDSIRSLGDIFGFPAPKLYGRYLVSLWYKIQKVAIPQLVALDLDGTSLNEHRELAPETVEAILRAHDSGLHIIFASGRMALSVETFSKPLGIPIHIVSSNGGYVESSDGREIYHATLRESVAHWAVSYSERNALHLQGYRRRQAMSLSDGPFYDLYVSRVKGVQPEIVSTEGFLSGSLTKVLFLDHPNVLDDHEAAFHDLLSPESVHIVRSEPDYLELLPPHVNKSVGLSALLKELGFEMRELAAIGDYLNDYEMLIDAGFSGAVANAHPKILESVDLVVPSNVEAGVARFLDEIIRKRGQ
jgi:Cof subfamily protein (haloacid dehalogenase superfamily)